jgi:hypothetical protein
MGIGKQEKSKNFSAIVDLTNKIEKWLCTVMTPVGNLRCHVFDVLYLIHI